MVNQRTFLTSPLKDKGRVKGIPIGVQLDSEGYIRIHLHEFDLPPDTAPRPIIASHLRQELGKLLELQPENLKFEKQMQGKPILSPAQNSLHLSFNLSHSEGRVLLGIAVPQNKGSPYTRIEIGVDIQKKRPVPFLKLAQRFFHPSEYEQLLHSEPSHRESLFFTLWTQKEAWVKCLGKNLASNLKHHTQDVLKDFSLESWSEGDFFYAIALKESRHEY